MYTKEEIVVKVNEIAKNAEAKMAKAKELSESALIDRGRLEELANMHNMIIAKEKELAEKPAPAKKAPAKRGKK